ncbi:MAG: radical SAM protein [Spirulina sp.]
MGFPKPWPTEWPEPDRERPEPSRERPDDTPDRRIHPEPQPNVDPEETPIDVPELKNEFRAVTWAVNHACNLNCTHCYDVVSEPRFDLNTRDALRVIQRLFDAGVRFIAFSGGEAFLRKDLFDLMAYCRDLGMEFGARSNGTRITDVVAAKLSVLGISVVGVSFDGATREIHDTVRGKGAFDAAISGLRALRARGIRAQMEVVLSRQNAHQSREFVELGQSIGASEVNFSAITPNGRGLARSADLLDRSLWLQLTDTLRDASKKSPISVTPNCAFVGICCANIEPHVTCDGWITPCYLSTEKLFHALGVDPAEFAHRLAASRLRYQDVCGRRAWRRNN